MAQILSQSDLIFPTASLSISSTLSSLKRSALSIHNRLSSITSDSNFIISVSEAYNFPLVANERCGGWYIPPEKKTESCYFKSTDGHMNEWGFNLRRLNLQVLGVVGRNLGCVIVDSTRRGKSMPDALSKTVPIWCCVMNRAIFPDSGPHALHTPPQAVSASEHAQIEKRIDDFVKQFIEICTPNIPDLRQKLQKPLRPLWITQASTLPESPPTFPQFHPVIVCTASRRVHGNEGSENGYIQGAADDQEAWSHGLTPKLFWRNKETLLSTNQDELPTVIADLVKHEKGPDASPILVKPTSTLFVSSSQNVDLEAVGTIISCTPEPLTTTKPDDLRKKYLYLPCGVGKLGSRDLRAHLPLLSSFLSSQLNEGGNILICCPTGRDLSVGVALAILCLYTNDQGVISSQETRRKIDKKFIKQRLTWLTTTDPTLNPSRGTLQSVNAYLMPDPFASSKATGDLGAKATTASQLTLLNANGIPIPISPTPPINTADPPSDDTVLSLPQTLFSALCTGTSSPWTFTRRLTSRLPSHPSGTVTGTASLTPSTSPSSSSPLLYAEEGDFVTTTGLKFTVQKKYVYQLKEDDGGEGKEKGEQEGIDVHFHAEEKESGIGELFVSMGHLKLDEGLWVARNRERHLCGEDLYTTSWRFGRATIEGEGDGGKEKGEEWGKWWEVRYDVLGPKKDYVSQTRYTMA